MRERVGVVRRRYGAGVVEEPAKDLVAAAYRHTTARGVEGAAAPDPQLHTHVVITGAVREDDRFVAVASRPIFRAGREVGAFYRSALAEELTGEGYAIERGTGTHGRYFELAGVPRPLCEAFSARRREIVRAAERFRARHGRARNAASCGNWRSRTAAPSRSPRGTDLQRASGRRPLRSTGSDPTRRCGSSARPNRASPAPRLEERIEHKLTEREAIFDPGTLRAVALEQTAGYMSPEQALALARSMVADRRILTLEGGRMTTLAVRAREQAIERRAAALGAPAGREVGESRPGARQPRGGRAGRLPALR